MRTALTLTASIAVLSIFPAGAIAADPPPAAQFSDLVEVSEVLLDVLVTDKAGNVVLGLDKDDFVVEERGTPVALRDVAFYSNRFLLQDGAAGRIQHPNEVPADRYFILFFDDQKNTANAFLVRQQIEASRQSKRWIAEEMLPGDWVAVVSWDYKLKVQQDFTQDRQALARAVDDAVLGKDPGNAWPSRRPSEGDAPSLLQLLPEGKGLRRATTRPYDALRLVAEATHDIPGRKNVLLFTLGFGRLNTFLPTTEPDPRFYEPMKRSLNDNNVAVYPIDLAPEADHLQENFLNQLAADTGGVYWGNFVNFRTPLEKIADENNGYYLLSYQAQHQAGESGYREVEVRTRNPQLRVRARQGYLYGP